MSQVVFENFDSKIWSKYGTETNSAQQYLSGADFWLEPCSCGTSLILAHSAKSDQFYFSISHFNKNQKL